MWCSTSLRGGGKRPRGSTHGTDLPFVNDVISQVCAWQRVHKGSLPKAREDKSLCNAWHRVLSSADQDTWPQELRNAVQCCLDEGAAAHAGNRWA
eukprot:10501066-Heterocapsa_arctica.AAC.1